MKKLLQKVVTARTINGLAYSLYAITTDKRDAQRRAQIMRDQFSPISVRIIPMKGPYGTMWWGTPRVYGIYAAGSHK